MQMAVWCLRADGACSDNYSSGRGEGVYVDVA